MRYKITFQFFETLEKSENFIKSRKGKKTTLTPWKGVNGQEKRLYCLVLYLRRNNSAFSMS